MRGTFIIFTYFIAASLGIPDDLNFYNEYPLSPRLKLQNVFQPLGHVKVKKSTEGTLIVGGIEAKPNQFPYQVSIQVYQYLEKYVHICGGVIYDELHVITAAHCVRGYHPRNLRIIAGEHDLTNEEGAEQIRDYVKYTYHSSFDPMMLYNDIAIITLHEDEPFDLNDFVKPIKLPSTNIEASGKAINTGWGMDENDYSHPKLQYVELDVISRQECEELYSKVSPITIGNICAGEINCNLRCKASCNGDSGGSLVCKDENGEDYLCGVVSWGVRPCGQGKYPTVFTNIGNYLTWLQSHLPPQQSSD